MLGRTLGSYRIVRQLGAGGMGVVYVAEHERLGRPAAVKVVSPELSSNQEVVERFFAEAVAAARIKHAGMVQVFDYGEDEETGCAFFAMELLEGEPLSARIAAQTVMHPAVALQLGEQIADCLEAAHGEGIVHRDLKPDNVFLVPDKLVSVGWRAKVLDFGVAKLAESDEVKSLRTRTGSVLGTPYYMSPEQSRGAGTVDHRSDIYSLGCVLFEMMTGRVPFPGEGLGEVLGAHQHVPPPAPRSINQGLPAAVDQLLLDCLAKSPDDRPQTMAELAGRLEAALLHVSEAGSTMVGTGIPRQATSSEASSNSASGVATAPTAGLSASTAGYATGTGAPSETTLGGAASQIATGAPEQPPAAKSPLGLITGAVALLAIAGGGTFLAMGGEPAPEPGPATNPDPPPPDKPARPATLDDGTGNRWILIEPPAEPVVLGVPDDAPDGQLGFRAARQIKSPTAPFYLHEHEVTFAELDPWLSDEQRKQLALGPWVPDQRTERAALPATGVPWEVALAYCKSRGGSLPSEEQWEIAARGADLRPSPWGSQRIDRDRTRVYGGEKGKPSPVMQQDQDETPEGVHDMLGNALEWTSDLWRMAKPGLDESWVQADGMTFRAVRGLPFRAPPPASLPRVPAAFRDARCTAGPCLDDARALLIHIGFRCERDAPAP